MVQGMDEKRRAEGNYLYSGEDGCLERAAAMRYVTLRGNYATFLTEKC
jgi:hypothetical protein